MTRSSHAWRDAGNLAQGAEGVIAGRTMLVGGQAVAAELAVVVDAAVGGQKALRVAG